MLPSIWRLYKYKGFEAFNANLNSHVQANLQDIVDDWFSSYVDVEKWKSTQPHSLGDELG